MKIVYATDGSDCARAAGRPVATEIRYGSPAGLSEQDWLLAWEALGARLTALERDREGLDDEELTLVSEDEEEVFDLGYIVEDRAERRTILGLRVAHRAAEEIEAAFAAENELLIDPDA